MSHARSNCSRRATPGVRQHSRVKTRYLKSLIGLEKRFRSGSHNNNLEVNMRSRAWDRGLGRNRRTRKPRKKEGGGRLKWLVCQL